MASYAIKQSSTAFPLVFFMTDSSDHISGKTGLSSPSTLTVRLSKNGGAFSGSAPSGTITEIGNGWYQVAGNATDTDTFGPLVLHASGTGADPCDVLYEVVALNTQDVVRLGLTSLPNVAQGSTGALVTSGTGTGQINVSSGVADSNLTKCLGTSVTAATAGIPNVRMAEVASAAVTSFVDASSIVDGKTLRQAFQIIAAAASGVTSGAGSGSETFKGLDGTTTRIIATISGGNRTAVSYP